MCFLLCWISEPKQLKDLKIFNATFGKKDDLTDHPHSGVFQYFRSYKSSPNTGHTTTRLEPAGSSPWRQAEKSSAFPVLYGRCTCKQNGQKCLQVPQNCFFGYLKNDGLFAISVCQCFISEELPCNVAGAFAFFPRAAAAGKSTGSA